MPGVAVGDLAGASGVMVDWEDEREKVLARGARWVSLSSERHGQLYACCSAARLTWGPVMDWGRKVPPTLGEFPRHFDGDCRSPNVGDSECESGRPRCGSKREVMQAGGGR